MRKFLALALLLVTLTACKSHVTLSDGKTYPCVGLGDDSLRASNVRYKPSVRNIALGVIFFEVVIPPIVVAVNKFYCPVALR